MDEPVKPLNIDKLLGHVRNRVSRVGIELEGGWRRIPDGHRVERDSSVFKNPTPITLEKLQILKIQYIGEVVSKPMRPVGMKGWLKDCYPTYADKSCGLHIHMSFKNIDDDEEDLRHYSNLMIPEYQQTVISYLKDWANREGLAGDHPIWGRLSGENEYCNHSFWPDAQASTAQKDYDHFRPGNRYSAIAYRYRKHKTLECRVLPMMADHAQAYKALKHILDITNACLVKVAKRNEKILDTYTGYDDLLVEKDVEEL